MIRYLHNSCKLSNLIYNGIINKNNNKFLNYSTISNNNTTNQSNNHKKDNILTGTIEIVPKNQSSTDSIRMLMDQLNNKKSKKQQTKQQTEVPPITTTTFSNKDIIIEDEFDNEEYTEDQDYGVEELDHDGEDYEEMEIYDENDRLAQYELDENRMEGMEDYVFDDEPEVEVKKSTIKKPQQQPKQQLEQPQQKPTLKQEEKEKQDDFNFEDNNNNVYNNKTNNEQKQPLTKQEQKEAKKRLQERIKKQYGDKANIILHKIEQKNKYGNWNPDKKITRADMNQLRDLYNEDSDIYNVPVLATSFNITEEAVHRIIRSKWLPDEKKLEKLHQRKVEQNRDKYSPYSKNKDTYNNNNNNSKQERKQFINLSYQSKIGNNNNNKNSNIKETPKIIPNSVIENIDPKQWYNQVKRYNNFRINETKTRNSNIALINNNNGFNGNTNSVFGNFNNNIKNFKCEKKQIDVNSKFERLLQLERNLSNK